MSSTGEGYQCGASVPQLSTVSIELRGRGGVGVALLIAKHDGAKATLRLSSPFAGEDETLASHGDLPKPRRSEVRGINHHSHPCIIGDEAL